MRNHDQSEWYRILDRLRKARGADPFTIEEMVEIAEISGTENSTARAMASGYISSLRKWGYVRRHEKQVSTGRGRPGYSYAVTDSGLKATLLASPLGDLERLMKAVTDLREAEGPKAESNALKNLYRIQDEITEAREESS
jgi:predicted ArsR family transcriptional regulator